MIITGVVLCLFFIKGFIKKLVGAEGVDSKSDNQLFIDEKQIECYLTENLVKL